MHMPHTPPPENLRVIGHTPGHQPLHSWSEGERTFEQRYERFTADSGIKYGVSLVYETTAERRLAALQSNQTA